MDFGVSSLCSNSGIVSTGTVLVILNTARIV